MEREPTSSLIADTGAQSTPQLELGRKVGLLARDLQDICRDNNSLPTLPIQWSSTVLSNLKTSKDSTTRANLGNYMRETEAQQLDEYRSRNGSAAISEYIQLSEYVLKLS